jgi:hypothetical protein
MSAPTETSVFELRAPALGSGGPVAGVWQSLPSVAAPVSFGAPGEPDAELSAEWRVALPADLGLARASIRAAELALEASRQALPAAIERVTALAQAAPEQFLVGEPTSEEVSFGLGGLGGLGDPLARLGQAAQALLTDLAVAVGPRAEVRTTIGGSWIGWTVVDGVSRVHSLHCPTASAEQTALHSRAVSLMLGTRLTLLRTIALALHAAALVATGLATPVGPLLAVPAAWRLIGEVQAQFRARKSPSGAFHH